MLPIYSIYTTVKKKYFVLYITLKKYYNVLFVFSSRWNNASLMNKLVIDEHEQFEIIFIYWYNFHKLWFIL